MAGWTKRGLLFDPGGATGHWTRSHAALPTPWLEGDDLARVYCSGRDSKGQSSVGYVDVRLGADLRVEGVARAPIIEPGRLGAFDDSGVTVSCVVVAGERRFLYFTGWTLGVTVPFYLGIGLATSLDGGRTFERVHEAPILGRSAHDPLMTASPWVLNERGKWRMWYVSADRWVSAEKGARHYYNIRYAESDDGVHWRTDGRVCLDFQDDSEYAFGRPCVVPRAGGYDMWFSVRGRRYRIGHASSSDGLHWTRSGEPEGLARSATGWDSEMATYPVVFETGGRRVMLYNGNGYGRTGFGWAEESPAPAAENAHE